MLEKWFQTVRNRCPFQHAVAITIISSDTMPSSLARTFAQSDVLGNLRVVAGGDIIPARASVRPSEDASEPEAGITSLEMTPCPYCSAEVACRPHVIKLGVDPRIQMFAKAGYCQCGFAVLTPYALTAIDDIARATTLRVR